MPDIPKRPYTRRGEKFAWTRNRELAAQLVAEDRLTNVEIGARCGVVDRQLERWKEIPEFRARVAEHLATYRAKITADGLADRINQIAFIKSRLADIHGIVESRGLLAVASGDWNAPGASTTQRGLQAHTVKSIGSGAKQQTVHEFALDTALIAEERALLQHLSILMGDWKQKVQLSGDVEVSVVDILRARRARREAAAEHPAESAPAPAPPCDNEP